MSRYTAAQRERALARELELNDKARKTSSRNGSGDDATERSAAVASQTELPWQQWVDDHVDARLNEFGEAIIEAVFSHYGPKTEKLKRENELLQREVTQLRETVALERGLKDLREQVEAAKNEVPKLPAIAQKLEEGQARLLGEITRTKEKVSKLRVNQSVADFKLNELRKAAAARAASLEMKVERTSVEMQIHPDAAAALRDYATETLKDARRDDKIWVFPGPPADAA
jgi:predicted nuclease with TOPRIM domain